MTDDLAEARKRRAELVGKYKSPFEAMGEAFRADWRAAWADACKKSGKTVPFEEWFYATDENGECPFEIAGGWFVEK